MAVSFSFYQGNISVPVTVIETSEGGGTSIASYHTVNQ